MNDLNYSGIKQKGGLSWKQADGSDINLYPQGDVKRHKMLSLNKMETLK